MVRKASQLAEPNPSHAPIVRRLSALPPACVSTYVWKHAGLSLLKPIREQLIDEFGEILASLQILQTSCGSLMRGLPQQDRITAPFGVAALPSRRASRPRSHGSRQRLGWSLSSELALLGHCPRPFPLRGVRQRRSRQRPWQTPEAFPYARMAGGMDAHIVHTYEGPEPQSACKPLPQPMNRSWRHACPCAASRDTLGNDEPSASIVLG